MGSRRAVADKNLREQLRQREAARLRRAETEEVPTQQRRVGLFGRVLAALGLA